MSRKSDYIRLIETNEEPRYSESQNIRETVEDNESIHDLLRLELFKEQYCSRPHDNYYSWYYCNHLLIT